MTPETRLTNAEIAGLLDPGADATYPVSNSIRRALRELVERREAESRDQRVLSMIDRITGDDFCEELDLHSQLGDGLTGELKTAHEKLSAIYRAAHSAVAPNTCHHVHDDWRKEADRLIGVVDAESGKEKA